MNLSPHVHYTICSTPDRTNVGTIIVMIIRIDLRGREGTEWWHRNLKHLLCCIIIIFVRSGTMLMCCYLTGTIFKLEIVRKEIACPVAPQWEISLYR